MTVKLLGAAAAGSTDAIRLADLMVGVMLWQTDLNQSVGIGRLIVPWVVPFAMVIDSVEYWTGTAGTGGTATAELRKNGTASGNTIASSSGTVAASSPTPATPNATLAAGDRIYVYQTAINTTTVGVGLAAKIVGHRV